jgi:3-hydroxy-D-aspartate aldolase
VLYPNLGTPEVLLELAVMERNIGRMASIAKEAKLKLRPYTKTHKSSEIAKLLKGAPLTKKFGMAF